MAREKRYELYEGDGEIIREESIPSGRRAAPLPGRRPLGRDEELQERDEQNRRERYEGYGNRRRYFRDTDDGLGEPSPLFDDFDRFEREPLRRPSGGNQNRKRKKKLKHRAAWISVIVICCVLLTGLGLLVLPQLTGTRYRFLPNFAFVNGTVLRYDAGRAGNFAATRRELYTDGINQGVYIDGIHVGGMTRAEAESAVAAANDMSGEAFDITVTVGNQSWHVNSERVPVTRNVHEIVEKAWAQGRSNTAAIRGTGVTPFMERANAASALRSSPVSFTTEKTYDHEALRAMTDGIVNYVNREPVNSTVASFDFGTKRFTFTDDRPGAVIDPDALYTRLCNLLDAGDYHASIWVEPEKVLADVTRTELMNRFGLISAYTTKTTSNKNRNTNIRLSAEAISGRTVLPGEIFSFNGTTGERTAAKGYQSAPAIARGQSRDEIGGGVCQTSSTLFNAVARADLEIVTRSPHAWPSSYIEKGLDATVNWPDVDFRFKNNTDWPIFIIAQYEKQKITVNIYGMSLGSDVTVDLESITTKVIPQPDGPKYVLNPDLPRGTSEKTVTGRKGYEVETWKIKKQNGKVISRELLCKSTYKAYQETYEYNPQ